MLVYQSVFCFYLAYVAYYNFTNPTYNHFREPQNEIKHNISKQMYKLTLGGECIPSLCIFTLFHA